MSASIAMSISDLNGVHITKRLIVAPTLSGAVSLVLTPFHAPYVTPKTVGFLNTCMSLNPTLFPVHGCSFHELGTGYNLQMVVHVDRTGREKITGQCGKLVVE